MKKLASHHLAKSVGLVPLALGSEARILLSQQSVENVDDLQREDATLGYTTKIIRIIQQLTLNQRII